MRSTEDAATPALLVCTMYGYGTRHADQSACGRANAEHTPSETGARGSALRVRNNTLPRHLLSFACVCLQASSASGLRTMRSSPNLQTGSVVCLCHNTYVRDASQLSRARRTRPNTYESGAHPHDLFRPFRRTREKEVDYVGTHFVTPLATRDELYELR
jgi:hypothetical protein